MLSFPFHPEREVKGSKPVDRVFGLVREPSAFPAMFKVMQVLVMWSGAGFGW